MAERDRGRTEEGLMEKGTRVLLDELKGVLGLVESPAPPMDGSLEDWEEWAKTVLPSEKEEAKAPKGVLKKHCSECSVECMQKNIRHFYHVRGDEIPRAVATSYSILRKSCGTPDDAPKMTPKEIVAKASKAESVEDLDEKTMVGPSSVRIKVVKDVEGDWEWSAEGERTDKLPKGATRSVKKDGKAKTRKEAFAAAFDALAPISADAPEEK